MTGETAYPTKTKTNPVSCLGGVGGFACQVRRLLRFGVDASDEPGSVGVGPVGMLLFEVRAHLFPGIVSGNSLPLEREGMRPNVPDQVPFGRHQRPVAGSAVVRQDV